MRNAEGENGTLSSKRDEGILINVKNNFLSSEMMQALQVYKVASSEWRNSIIGFRIIVERKVINTNNLRRKSTLEESSASISKPL